MRVLMASAVLFLAACGAKPDKADERTIVAKDAVKVTQSTDGQSMTMTGTGPDGATSTFQSGAAAKLPADLPDFVKIYPGLQINGVMSGSSGDGAGGMITAHSSDDMAKVIAFYREHIKTLGFPTKNDQDMGEQVILSTMDGEARTLMVAVSKAEQGSDLHIQYGKK